MPRCTPERSTDDCLFSFANGGINCKDPSHPLFIAFYKPTIVTAPDPPPAPPQP